MGGLEIIMMGKDFSCKLFRGGGKRGVGGFGGVKMKSCFERENEKRQFYPQNVMGNFFFRKHLHLHLHSHCTFGGTNQKKNPNFPKQT